MASDGAGASASPAAACVRRRSCLQFPLRWVPHPESCRTQHEHRLGVGCEFTAVWLGEGESARYSAHGAMRPCWSSLSPALEKLALIRVTGTVTSNPPEAISEKGLKKRCRKVIRFAGNR